MKWSFAFAENPCKLCVQILSSIYAGIALIFLDMSFRIHFWVILSLFTFAEIWNMFSLPGRVGVNFFVWPEIVLLKVFRHSVILIIIEKNKFELNRSVTKSSFTSFNKVYKIYHRIIFIHIQASYILRSRQNGRQFTDDVNQMRFHEWKSLPFDLNAMKFVLRLHLTISQHWCVEHAVSH